MITFEIANSTQEHRKFIREIDGVSIEYIDLGLYNVRVPDAQCDNLTDFLEAHAIGYRMI